MVHLRPHTLLAAALLQLATAHAGDVTVIKTETRTHTVCPLSALPPTCSPPSGQLWSPANVELWHSWNDPSRWASPIDAARPTGAGDWEDWESSSSTIKSGVVTSSGSTGRPSSHTNAASSTTSVVASGSIIVDTLPTYIAETSNTGFTVSNSTKPSSDAFSPPSTSSTTAPTSSATPPSNSSTTSASAIFPRAGNTTVSATLKCNTAEDRSQWCDGKSIDSDYYEDYSSGNVCSYNFVISNASLSFDGAQQLAFAINGQSPGPVIECNWGDLIQVKVTNNLQNNATSIHWHGIRQSGTNDQDGVPGISECGIAPGSSRMYTFRASSYGTGWYHSHLLSQYGDGLRGPMIIHGPATANYDIDMGTVMVNDNFPVTAAQQAWRVAHIGPTGTSNYLLNGKNKSPDMSTGEHTRWTVQSGKKHLFRFINAASQDIYSVHFDNHKMTVIAADYVPIVPYETEWLKIANGQRYDVIVEMDQPVAGYFLRAVVQTSCPSSSLNNGLGNANGIIQYDGASDSLPTSTPGGVTAATFATCVDEPLASLVPHLQKSAGSSSAFAASASTLPAGQVATRLTSDDGTVFSWFLNNAIIDVNYDQPTLQTLATGADSSLISNAVTISAANQWVYFVIQNQFFASHPMHLHGHDMSILGTGVGTFSDVSTLNFVNPIRRDTVMLQGSSGPGNPSGYTVIGFESNNPGAWLMHCHIAWHVEGGLALQFIERPDDINAGQYVNTSAWSNECSAMVDYESNPSKRKSTGTSGLKRGIAHDEFANGVVRRDATFKRHLGKHARRGSPSW